MPKLLAPREDTLLAVEHPVQLPGGRLRVDHPAAAVLTDGYSPAGWEGDVRLALYSDVRGDRWEVWRLDADRKYRIVCRSEVGARLSAQLMHRLVKHLVAHDGRRGFDALEAIDRHNAAHEARVERDHSDYVTGELADRLRHALIRDGVHRH